MRLQYQLSLMQNNLAKQTSIPASQISTSFRAKLIRSSLNHYQQQSWCKEVFAFHSFICCPLLILFFFFFSPFVAFSSSFFLHFSQLILFYFLSFLPLIILQPLSSLRPLYLSLMSLTRLNHGLSLFALTSSYPLTLNLTSFPAPPVQSCSKASFPHLVRFSL